MGADLNILCMGSFNTGDRFLERARERGCKVWVLTKQKHLGKPWRRDLLEDLLALPDDATLQQTLNAVCYLNRTTRFDRIIPFDDLEVDSSAMLREHLRIPGMGETSMRGLRDKLAMRVGIGSSNGVRTSSEIWRVPPVDRVLLKRNFL